MYDKIIARIQSQQMGREELFTLRTNAAKKLAEGVAEAATVIAALDATSIAPQHAHYVFMGFCPGADISRRQDEIWLREGICKYDWVESKSQLARFRTIIPGDAIIMKKREEFGKSMMLYHHGIVSGASELANGGRVLNVDWRSPDAPIKVPLLGCNSTVDVRDLAALEQMPAAFWQWLHPTMPRKN